MANMKGKRHYTDEDERLINNYLHSDEATPEGYLALLDKFRRETDVHFFDLTLIAANVAYIKQKRKEME